MKTNIAGLIYYILFTIVTIIGAFALVVSLISFGRLGVIVDSHLLGVLLFAVLFAVIYLAFGIFGMVWSSQLRKHKKWTWNVGVILLPIGFISGILSFVLGNNASYSIAEVCSSLVGIVLGAFTFYALLNEKNLFLGQVQNTSVSPQVPPVVPPTVSSQV